MSLYSLYKLGNALAVNLFLRLIFRAVEHLNSSLPLFPAYQIERLVFHIDELDIGGIGPATARLDLLPEGAP